MKRVKYTGNHDIVLMHNNQQLTPGQEVELEEELAKVFLERNDFSEPEKETKTSKNKKAWQEEPVTKAEVQTWGATHDDTTWQDTASEDPEIQKEEAEEAQQEETTQAEEPEAVNEHQDNQNTGE